MTDPPTTDPELLSIGAFASAARLTPKALRLYGDLGLLPPARVDAQTGYRFYSPAQLPGARLIGLLRGLDLPLADVRAVLDAPPERRPEELRVRWAAVKAAHARREALARYVQGRLQGDTEMTDFDIQTREVPARHLATLTRSVFVRDLPATIQQSIGALQTLIEGTDAAAFAGPPLVIFHGEVNADSDGPIEVCWPYSGTLAPTGDVTLREESAHHEAFVVLTRAQFEFPAILRAYDATADYAAAHGQSGPQPPGTLHPREVYPYDWDAAGEDGPAGEVAWPYTPTA